MRGGKSYDRVGWYGLDIIVRNLILDFLQCAEATCPVYRLVFGIRDDLYKQQLSDICRGQLLSSPEKG